MDDRLDETDARIAALGTVSPPSAVRDETMALVTRLEDAEVRRSAERTRHRGRAFVRGKAAIVGAAIALAGITVAVPATALSTWLARTGEFGDPSTSTEVDDSEWIDLTQPDASEVVIEAYPETLTLPDGVTRGDAIRSVSKDFERMSDGIAQEGLMTQHYEFFAICAWANDWYEADAASDESRAERASAWLLTTENYPELTSMAAQGSNVVEVLLGFVEQGRQGDLSELKTFCPPADGAEQ